MFDARSDNMLVSAIEVFDHLDTLVRQSVEETINSLLDAEKAKVVVEFENFSFHPFQQQSSQRSKNTGTSN